MMSVEFSAPLQHLLEPGFDKEGHVFPHPYQKYRLLSLTTKDSRAEILTCIK